MKLKKLLFNLVFVAAAVACGIYLSLGPWRVYHDLSRQTAQQEQSMRQAETQHAKDLIDEAHYSSSAGREELARKQGHLKQNEVLLSP
jgi:hypothetical protein